ncbi:hypothetical protein RGQ13_16195 [Thalassotalea psychrophila]|uniref:Uncharacterized protein n=1 Tax=Thalassotalea psychrophila TaxID=3065647 RepID=A0ABY9TS47_9GAMM|nr:hypothetical protein RGQ13_16195 [Colwelliaceae bacterium SQ149]
MKFIALVLSALISLSAYSSEDLKVVADLKFLSDTGVESTKMCIDGGCDAWATFYLYELDVKKVLSGELADNKFKVIYGRHAEVKADMNSVVVVLHQLKGPQNHNAQYQVLQIN